MKLVQTKGHKYTFVTQADDDGENLKEIGVHYEEILSRNPMVHFKIQLPTV